MNSRRLTILSPKPDRSCVERSLAHISPALAMRRRPLPSYAMPTVLPALPARPRRRGDRIRRDLPGRRVRLRDMSIWKRAQIKNGPTPFRVPGLSSSSEAYFLVLEEPVVVWWPGAYSDAPGAVDFFAFCILWPGAYSDAPGAVDVVLICIRWPGALPDEPGEKHARRSQVHCSRRSTTPHPSTARYEARKDRPRVRVPMWQAHLGR